MELNSKFHDIIVRKIITSYYFTGCADIRDKFMSPRLNF